MHSKKKGQNPTTKSTGRKRGRRPDDATVTLFGKEVWGRRYAPGDDPVRRRELRTENFRTLVYAAVAIATGSEVLPPALRALGVG
jgi:hypothetical protein